MWEALIQQRNWSLSSAEQSCWGAKSETGPSRTGFFIIRAYPISRLRCGCPGGDQQKEVSNPNRLQFVDFMHNGRAWNQFFWGTFVGARLFISPIC